MGTLLAERLGRGFVDCDAYIENKTNLCIREIFDIAGESYFRMLEGDAIGDLSKQDGVVIATGGGAVLKYKNIHNLKRNGIIIFLDVSPDIVIGRIGQDPSTPDRRPPLTRLDPAEEIHQQIQARRPYYQGASDITIRTDLHDVEEVVRIILEYLKAEYGLEERPNDDKDEAIA